MQPKPFGLSLLEQAAAPSMWRGLDRTHVALPVGMRHWRRIRSQRMMRGGLAGRGTRQRGRARGLAAPLAAQQHPSSYLLLQNRHTLNMGRLWKQIKRCDQADMVATCHQRA